MVLGLRSYGNETRHPRNGIRCDVLESRGAPDAETRLKESLKKVSLRENHLLGPKHKFRDLLLLCTGPVEHPSTRSLLLLQPHQALSFKESRGFFL